MTVISPWSRGGWVCSEVFDHTSVIQFLERWTGVAEPNISAWRRAVCGDLTSAFDFSNRNTAIPMLPDVVAAQRAVDVLEPDLPDPVAPEAGDQDTPDQEPGSRPIRPAPYQLTANLSIQQGSPIIRVENHGPRPTQIAVHAEAESPTPYLLQPNERTEVAVPLSAEHAYRVALHGPVGFIRHFADAGTPTRLDVQLNLVRADSNPALRWTVENSSGKPMQLTVTDALTQQSIAIELPTGATRTGSPGSLSTSNGWYDVTFDVAGAPGFERRYAGHLEDGQPSTTRPQRQV
jgi:phospholipase C